MNRELLTRGFIFLETSCANFLSWKNCQGLTKSEDRDRWRSTTCSYPCFFLPSSAWRSDPRLRSEMISILFLYTNEPTSRAMGKDRIRAEGSRGLRDLLLVLV